MTTKAKTPAPAASRGVNQRADEVGMPTLTAKIIGPDGAEVELPTWAAAAIEELAAMKKQEQPAPAAASSSEPPPPAGDEAPPPPSDDDEEEEEEKDPPMTPDAVAALVRKRSRLARLADKAGVEASVCDSADDLTLARAYVAKRMPWLKTDAEKATGPALDALVDAAEKMPGEDAPPVRRNVFERPAPRGDAAATTADHPLIKFMSRQGYGALPA